MWFFVADRVPMNDHFGAWKIVHDQEFNLIGDVVGLEQ